MTDTYKLLNKISNMVSELANRSMEELYNNTADDIPELIMICASKIRTMRDEEQTK